MFRKRFTWINIGVSILGYVSWLVWYSYRFVHDEIDRHFFYHTILPTAVTPFVFSAALTALFLHQPREEISVYDPKLNQSFIKEKVVDTIEDDEDYMRKMGFVVVLPLDNNNNGDSMSFGEKSSQHYSLPFPHKGLK